MQYTQLSRRSALVKSSDIDWEKQYLTFIPVEDAVFSWAEKAVSGHLEYSVNGGQTWVTIANGGSTPTIMAGGNVIWRGDLKPSTNNVNGGGIGTFSATGNYEAYGNTMSLLFYSSYYNRQLDSAVYDFAFYNLFYNDAHMLSAPLVPATTLSSYCYNNMFNGCTSLTIAPELPATILTIICYSNMFANCTSLVNAPELPATTLADSCYGGMFDKCTSLVTAPKLPAITLSVRCYAGMFRKCTSLVTAPELPATNLATSCYKKMFYGCSSLNYIKALFTTTPATTYTGDWVSGVAAIGTFVKNRKATWTTTGVNGIPTGWTVVTDNQ